jgi:hypothetical protein
VDVAAIGLVAAVGREINAELSLRRFYHRVGFAGGNVIALAIEQYRASAAALFRKGVES